MYDVLIVGAGPAGSVAAILLAKAGARVRLVDRAAFPREKLCGDTLNPGTLAVLSRLGLDEAAERRGLRLEGMVVTGEGGAMVESAYPRGLHGVALGRSVLDAALVQEAMRTGASFEPGVAVREAIVEERRNGRLVTGVSIGAGGQERPLAARVVIGADGRRSTLAFKLGLASHASKPRRWAIGAYFEEAGAQARRGEMHIRRGRYIGVAPLPGGLANVCLVKPSGPGDPDLHEPEAALRREIAAEPLLRDRYAGARLVRPPIVLGPLAVDSSERAIDGLILAGDAAGFIDPITGDGLRFAVRGAEMAAASALHALAHGWSGVHARLAAGRRREFGAKWRFNRALRLMVSDARTIQLLAATARLAPGATRAMIEYAGDCGIARHAPAAPRAGVAEFT